MRASSLHRVYGMTDLHTYEVGKHKHLVMPNVGKTMGKWEASEHHYTDLRCPSGTSWLEHSETDFAIPPLVCVPGGLCGGTQGYPNWIGQGSTDKLRNKTSNNANVHYSPRRMGTVAILRS